MVVELIEKSWNAYKKNFWTIIGALVILLVASVLLILIGIVPLYMGVSVSAMLAQNPALLFASFVIIAIGIILGMLLGAGLIGIYADALKRKAKINTMFRIVKQKFWTILGANILVGVISMIILGLALTPLFALTASGGTLTLTTGVTSVALTMTGIIIAVLILLLFALTNQAIVIDNLKAVPSIKKSVNVVKTNYLQFLLLVIIIGIFSIIVNFIPIIGFFLNLFLVSPIGGIAFTAFYINKRRVIKKRKIKKRKIRKVRRKRRR
ncbi:MAG: hypothetical protein ACE5J4_00825 [Candidatus Aenigmatarchaeota archaeon]